MKNLIIKLYLKIISTFVLTSFDRELIILVGKANKPMRVSEITRVLYGKITIERLTKVDKSISKMEKFNVMKILK